MLIILSPTFSGSQLEISMTEGVKFPVCGDYNMNNKFTLLTQNHQRFYRPPNRTARLITKPTL